MSMPLTRAQADQPLLRRAIDSDCAYFEMGAERRQLDGATLAWMPGLTSSPAAAVIHRVDADALAAGGAAWIVAAERAMAGVGGAMTRIYLEERGGRAEQLLKDASFVSREELVFIGSVPESAVALRLRPVISDSDWADKLRFHQAADGTPDGHGNRATEWVELERRKCGAGMEAYLAELDGDVVGAIGALWCDGFVRAKNLVVDPDRRRRGVGRAILACLAELGRQRGLSQQCFLAVRGEHGELLYRSVGLAMIGSQVEWSKPTKGGAQ